MSKPGWRRVSKRFPCPICGNSSFCTVNADMKSAKCMRVESAHPITDGSGTGYFHDLDGKAATAAKSLASAKTADKLKVPELRALLKQHKTALSPDRLARLGKQLGLSAKSLQSYGIGWDSDRGAYSFPMYDGTFDPKGNANPCGIRHRFDDGQKGCVVGSRNGIFMPTDADPGEIIEGVCNDEQPLLLLMPEGPTDACAARDMGFRAIGRPNNSGGGEQITFLLRAWRQHKQDVVIVADRDETKYLANGEPHWPGIEGAVSLAETIRGECGRLRFLLPPEGVKDLREWLRREHAQAQLIACIANAAQCPVVDSLWIERAKRRLRERKAKERRGGPPAVAA